MKTLILKIPINTSSYLLTIKKIHQWIATNKKKYICVAATHLVIECQKDPHLLAGVQNADIVTPDGMPLVWLSKLYGNKNASRVYGPNLMLILCKLAEKFGYKVFLLGGAVGQSKKLNKKLQERFPKLKIVGSVDTPIRPISNKNNKKIIKQINLAKPDIVFVGLGCPNQELWMINNRNKISASILIGVGAAFDFITGEIKQAPMWMQNSGFEWLFRLIQDPKRLLKRYTLTNITFLFKITKQIILDILNGKLPA